MSVPIRRGVAAARARSVASVRRWYGRMPLRVKLVAVALLLVVLALAGSGIAAAATLRTYLVGRVDTQLSAAEGPIADHQLGSVAATTADNGAKDRSVLPSTFVVEVTDASGQSVLGPRSNLVDDHEPLPDLPNEPGAESRADGRRLFTVHAVHGDEQWRVLATPITLSDGSTGTLLIAQSLRDVQNTIDRFALLSLGIGAAAVIVLAGVGYLVVRASLRPLREVERTAGRIAGGDLSSRVPERDRRTEVGQLSASLNTMLAQIERAFAEQSASEARMRRFVADASHELRTPLTSIRGFAELFRQGAMSGPDDVRRAMTRIEGEAKRMGLLVEDLLLLARLDQERPLERAPVDLLALAGDAVQDARAVEPARAITLAVGRTDPPPVVLGDERRLRQVVGNLVANALQHTPSGTAVRIVVGTDEDGSGRPTVTLTVSDDGPGMSDEHAARVFERFFRADTARTHGADGAGGSGLGLAIVAALVAAHDGQVAVRTSPGAGASFDVTLPAASQVPDSRDEGRLTTLTS